MQNEELANRLIACARAVEDMTAAEAGDLSASAVAAIFAIRAREPISIQDIATIVGLTHSATVRLVDRLEKDWLVRRQRRRGREVLVETTSRGKRRVRDLHAKRTEAVTSLIAELSAKDQTALGAAIDAVLVAAMENGMAADALYRFCDRQSEAGASLPLLERPEDEDA